MTELFDIIKASDMASKTSDAYMYDRYGREKWIQCIIFLSNNGLDEKQIEEILRSKHMRWSKDCGLPKESESDSFIAYYHANINNIKIEFWANYT